MRILVTGATGFIGKNLVKKLSKSHDVYAYVRNTSNTDEIGEFCSPIKNLEKQTFDIVIHLASCFLASHNQEDIDNLINSNVLLGTKLVDKCEDMKVKYFINIGTYWQHYNGEEYNPVNLYAATKQAFEDVLKFYSESTDLKVINLKLNDTFGPGDTRRKVFNLWNEISASGEILGMSPGEQLIDIVFINDVISAFEKIIEYLPNQQRNIENYKIESQKKYQLKELAQEYSKVSGNKLSINWGERPYRDKEVMNPECPYDTVPGWKPLYSFEDGMKEVLK